MIHGKKTFVRWLKFNFVGLIGVAVQLLALSLLAYGLKLDYLFATFLAVELTIVHNFLWHERFTWADRSDKTILGRVGRLVRFNLSNGAVSLAGNLLLMRLLVDQAHLPVLVANAVAILTCSLLNFAISDQFVFRPDSGMSV